ncbi:MULTISPECIES: hypothetical protein [unclassified Saccharothrix]|uniref:hypothetical protein n=1 Tax=unclassified Saccharothrix TaxID=2593673 RepID=UPI00307E82AD
MTMEAAAPCRHAGAPPEEIVERVSQLIRGLAAEDEILSRHGLSVDEFAGALPMAIEALRGRTSASNAQRREFLRNLFTAMLDKKLISALAVPKYGADTVYRLTVDGFGDIAVIQKGCPDGAHSSRTWEAPEWAEETYLWWLCPSLKSHPGEHVVKGVNRLRKRFFSDREGELDGVVFHNELCGTAERICPKASSSITINGELVPPPCIYVMPSRSGDGPDWNWKGEQTRVFPEILLRLFGVPSESANAYIGHIGFQERANSIATRVTANYGPGRSTKFRS